MKNKKYNIYKIFFTAIIVCYGFFSFIGYANATSGWWDANWQSRRKITFNNASSSENLVNFPVLVLLNATNSSNIDYSKTQNSGQDIRFVDADDQTALNYEIELWDETATSAVWVRVPQIDANATTDYIWMYYNNTTAVDNATTSGVWDANFKVVTHFKETSGSIASDSTVYMNNATSTGTTATSSGIIGYAREFDGSDDRLGFGSDASIDDFTQKTISLIILRDITGNTSLLSKDGDGSAWELYFRATDQIRYGALSGNWQTSSAFTSTSTVYHIALTHDASSTSNDPVFIVNGVVQSVTENVAPTSTSSIDNTEFMYLGETGSGTGDFDGIIDELRYSNIVRSPSWLIAEYKNGANAYNTFASEENLSFTQKDYRWYENTDAINPTTALAFGNTEAIINSTTSPLRLRANITSHSTLATSSQTFKLQYSQSLNGGWTDANSWWNTSWKNRRKITFNNASSSENLVNFPVLVLLNATNSSNIDYSKTQNSGQDIRFVDADDQTALNYEIELWDETATSAVWVRVPQIDANATTDYIWMYYNNTSASDSSTTSGVWDDNYKWVSHFGSNPAIATDSTQYINHGTSSAGVSSTTTGVVAGYGFRYGGASGTDATTIATSPQINDLAEFTWCAWVYPTALNDVHGILMKAPGNLATGKSLFIHTDPSLRSPRFFVQRTAITSEGTGANALVTNTRFFLCLTGNTTNGGKIWQGSATSSLLFSEIAYSGVVQGSGSLSSDSTSRLFIGNRASADVVTTDEWDGVIDEVRISNIVRSVDWLRAENRNGFNQYNTFSAEEDVASTTWLFTNNASVTDNATITTPLLSTSEWGQSYQENNITVSNPNAIPAGQEGEWDFALHPYNATTTTYYFRLVRSNGTALENYENYPTLIFNNQANLSQIHYRWRNDDGNEANATFVSGTDSALANFSKRMPLRLRIQISNEGAATSSPTQFQLEYGQKITSCSAINAWIVLPNTGTANTEHWSLVNVANINNGASTTNNSEIPDENTFFVAGEFRSTSNITSAYSLSPSEFTELEWALWAEQASSDGQPYCFRITNKGSTINITYSVYPELSLRQGGQTAGLSSAGSPAAATPTTGGTQGQGQDSVDGGSGGSGQTGGGTQGGGSTSAP